VFQLLVSVLLLHDVQHVIPENRGLIIKSPTDWKVPPFHCSADGVHAQGPVYFALKGLVFDPSRHLPI
jgi:hypothetical protein